jgi:competence protein ComEC
LLAHWRGRPGDLLTSLLMTTAVVVAITPSIRLDIGFQLSVAATLGLVLLLERGTPRSWWYSALAVPFVAEVAIAPLLLHHLGAYSLLSPMANLITAPLVELVMFGGLTTLLGAAIHPALGSLFGVVTWVPAHLILEVASRTASITWSSSTTETIGWSTTFLIYAVMLLLYWGIVSWSGGRAAALEKSETTSAI